MGYGFAKSIASLIPMQNLRHSLSALVFATQNPYPGRQNFLIIAQAVPIQQERYAICPKNFLKNING
jgi:hypothetical protein